MASGASNIAEWQGASEDLKYAAKPTTPKTDSSGCFGIDIKQEFLMDKRSLLFLACISVSYFGLHLIFGGWGPTSSPSMEGKAAIERSEKITAAESERLTRTASLSELPLVALYTDPLARGTAGNALRLDDSHYMTLAGATNLPAKVYVSKEETFEVLTIHGSTLRKEGEAVIYLKENGAAAPVELPPIPYRADLHLLALNEDPKVVLAELKGTDLAFPYAYMNGPAIAFLKQNHHFLPVGVFEPAKNKVTPFTDLDHLQNIVSQPRVTLVPTTNASESFYVLETDYQQLVFSTRGGSLAEINLPLKTSKDATSLIKEIDIDRKIIVDSPQNAHFPLHPYLTANDSSPQTDGTLGGYYPLLRRPIMNADGTEKTKVPSQFYALNILADGDETPANYRVQEFNSRMIKMEASDGRRRITKTYTIPEEKNGPYCFDLEIQIDGDASGLWLSSGVPDVELVGGSYAPQLKYQVRTSRGTDVEEIKLPKAGSTTDSQLSPYWISNCNGFLGLIIDPLTPMPSGFQVRKINGADLPTRLSTIDASHHLYPAENYPGYMTLLPLKAGTTSFRVFAGPYDEALLKELDELYADPTTNYIPDYTRPISIRDGFLLFPNHFQNFYSS